MKRRTPSVPSRDNPIEILLSRAERQVLRVRLDVERRRRPSLTLHRLARELMFAALKESV